MKRSAMICVVSAAALAAFVLLLGTGCRQAGDKPSLPLMRTDTADAEFAGSEACAECHNAEFQLHQKTHHAITLRPVSSEALGTLMPPAGPIGKTRFAVRSEGNRLVLYRKDDPQSGAAMQYATGSGKYLMTYLADLGPDRLTELSMSYHPRLKDWYITPGQERDPRRKVGVVNELGRARKCILCHAVRTKSDSAEPPPGFLGVGCESCHGPGRPHIAAVKARSSDIKMEKMGSWGASRVNASCGKCHRTAADLTPGALEYQSTARFQPYGLELSPCFKKTADRLSCTTCHNPHTDAETNPKIYERICLSCHSGKTADSHVCPVNPKEKCIGCHMPKVPVFAAAGLPISMADHLIWANRPQKGKAKTR